MIYTMISIGVCCQAYQYNVNNDRPFLQHGKINVQKKYPG